METNGHYKHLERRVGSGYRQLFIKGKRIRAEILYGLTIPAEDGEVRSPEEVAQDYDLPLEVVLEAIEYCKANPTVIEEDHQREWLMMEAAGINHPEYKYRPGEL